MKTNLYWIKSTNSLVERIAILQCTRRQPIPVAGLSLSANQVKAFMSSYLLNCSFFRLLVGGDAAQQHPLHFGCANVVTCQKRLQFPHTHTHTHTHTHIYIYIYTECPRRNGQNFGRVFLMLKYTDITQNTYIQTWTVTEIMAREVWNFDSCYTLIDYQIHIKPGRNMWFL